MPEAKSMRSGGRVTVWRRVGLRRPYLRKPALRHEQETEEGELRGRGRQEQVLRRPEQGEEGDAEEPADQEPDREARDDAWEELLHLAHVEQPARLPADEHEPDLERDREGHEEHSRHPRAVRHENHPRDGVEGREAAERRRRDANEAGAACGTGDERRRAAADHRDRDVRRGQPLGAVHVQEDRVRRHEQEGERHSKGESLPGEEGDDAARRRVAHRVRSA